MAKRKPRKIHEQGHTRKFLTVIDDSPECESAVYFAAARARRTGSSIVLLYVIEPEEFQHWLSVEEIHREEGEQRATAVLRLYARKLKSWGFDDVPAHEDIRHGEIIETVTEVIDTDEDIALLVLGASTSAEGPGRMVTWLSAGKQAGHFPTPIVLVPGALDFSDIDALA